MICNKQSFKKIFKFIQNCNEINLKIKKKGWNQQIFIGNEFKAIIIFLPLNISQIRQVKGNIKIAFI